MSVHPSRSVLRDRRAVALLLAATLTTMANAAISPALPGLEARFAHHPQAALLTRMLIPAPSVAVVLLAGWAGLLADRSAPRRLLLLGVGLFAIAGCSGVLLHSLPALLLSRFALGAAVALIMTAQTVLIADYFEGAARTVVLGLQISARNIGGFVSITLAGALAVISPNSAFAIHGLALVMLPFLWRALPVRARSDLPRPRPTTQDAGDRALGRGLWAMAALQMLTTLCFFTMPTQLPYFISGLGVTNTAIIGSVLGTLTLAGALVATRYARWKPRLGHSGLFALGFSLMGGGMLTLSQATELRAIYAGAGLVGLGFAIVSPNFNEIALNSAPPSRRGRAAGVMTTSVFLGQIASPLLSLPILRVLGYSGLFLAIVLPLGVCAGAALVIRLRSLPFRLRA
ncbi:MFS transporter [Phaeobacter sp. B1627]|uniref:MFS transporter n=1 Tax=Phaeobacter sp. B1627 TaxID=2583809 RepID=UPI001118C4E8|nr:MFS transporter [Phaeobacter sp. B1627]TNJ41118.1 MFS transporter [Phaeobacter sp. B1627]